MYVQLEKSKANRDRSITNPVTQKMSVGKQRLAFVDNRPNLFNGSKNTIRPLNIKKTLRNADAYVHTANGTSQSGAIKQFVANNRHFSTRKTRYASRAGGNIGSVYALNTRGSYNRGYRIRLDHRSGPHISKRRTYRYETGADGALKLLSTGKIGLGGGRLREKNTQHGNVIHKSSGALGDMRALGDVQARVLCKLALASDKTRGQIGHVMRFQEAEDHAEYFNRRMRQALRNRRFERHELGRGQRTRDLIPGAPYP